MARDLPPATSAMSVMAIPLVGHAQRGTWITGEVPHWQDWLAMGFVMVAIASVLLPAVCAAAAAGRGTIARCMTGTPPSCPPASDLRRAPQPPAVMGK